VFGGVGKGRMCVFGVIFVRIGFEVGLHVGRGFSLCSVYNCVCLGPYAYRHVRTCGVGRVLRLAVRNEVSS
jgi:hypothetical protein